MPTPPLATVNFWPFPARLTVAAVFALVACSVAGGSQQMTTQLTNQPVIDYRLHIECDCEWSAIISGDEPVDSSGYVTLDLPEDVHVCATITKRSERGPLRARVIPTDRVWWNVSGQREETLESYGLDYRL